MQNLCIIARPSPIDLMQNRFPHNNPLSHVIVATDLKDALAASNKQKPDISPNERTFQHLKMPSAMMIYYAVGDATPYGVAPGKTAETYGSIFNKLQITEVETFLSEDPLHKTESDKSKEVDVICENISFALWQRVAKLEEYTQAYHIYTKTPPEALKIWFQNITKAESGATWQVPYSGVSYFNMYYELSPFKGDVERSAQYATAKTAMVMRQSRAGAQELVIQVLEDNAAKELGDVGVLYGHQTPSVDCTKLLQHTLPLVLQIHPENREAFVKGVQTSAALWEGESQETMLTNAYHGFVRNHPQYKHTLDAAFQEVVSAMHSPVPMMVYGYWEGTMQQKYGVTPGPDVQTVFLRTIEMSHGYSEMQRIADALNAAQVKLTQEVTPGIEIIQEFTAAHLQNGMFAPVCMAWVPDDIRPNVEHTFELQKRERDDLLAMSYALASGMAKCNEEHNSAYMMRDISTVMNEVVMRAYNAGVYPQDITDIMNAAFNNSPDTKDEDVLE